MQDLRRMTIFAAVVEAGSFTAAAARLGMSKSAVSRHVRHLEERYSAQLLLRTTRRMVPTAAGTRFYRRCAELRRIAQAAADELATAGDRPRGTLRVTAPVGLGERLVAPALGAFLRDNPEVDGALILSEAVADLLADGFDVAVRAGRLRDSSLIARKVAPLRLMVCASPAYLDAAPRIRAPRDLAAHPWILFSTLGAAPRLVFRRRGRQQTVRPDARLRTNNGDAIVSFMEQGLGLGVLPAFMVSERIARRALRQVLPGYELPMGEIYAVYPAMRFVPPKVRGFVDALAASLREA